MATEEIVFHSKYLGLQLVRKPKLERPLATGGWETTQPSLTYKFTAAPKKEGGWVGVLRVKAGEDVAVDGNGWLAPGQEPGRERDVVEALRAHREFGAAGSGHGDFWEAGFEPSLLLPREVDFRDGLMAAVAALNADEAQRLLDEESAGNARPELLREAQNAVSTINAALESLAAQQPQEAAPAAKKATARKNGPDAD